MGAIGALASHAATGDLLPAASRVPVGESTVYDLASVTKVYTAVTLLALAGEGAFRLDEPVARWLPEYRTDQKTAVTVAHLLSHTAGLPASWEGWHRHVEDIGTPQSRWGPRSRARVLADILEVRLVRPAGREFEYSCLGYITAMAVAERATGRDWGTLVVDHLLHPLELHDTTFRPDVRRTAPTERQPRLGRPLVHGVVHDETAYALGGVSGNAGLFATVPDVLRFGEAVLDGLPGVLRPEVARLLWENQLPAMLGPGDAERVRSREGFGHSLGLRIGQTSFMGRDCAHVRGHTGFTGTSLIVDRERGVVATLLTNRVHPHRDGPDLMPVRAAVADLVRGG